jgi:hypothetical protein
MEEWKPLTALVAIKDARHADQVQRHSKLGIGLDVQWLLPRETGSKAGCGVLAARQACVGNVEQLGRVWWWRERIGVPYPGDIILVDHSLAAASRL